jgi:regulation of enolase protein 1 (concanavalin A-like superfamily)
MLSSSVWPDIDPTEGVHRMLATILLAALAATAQDGEQKWEVVTSEQGTYSVELPESNHQKGSVPFIGLGLRGTMFEILRQPGDMIYRIKQYDTGKPIAKANEGRWLDYVRDEETGPGSFGKVVSEKKVKLGSIEGREYDYLKDSFGSKTEARARAFVKGATVYILLASPGRGDKPDPAKTDRFFSSFALIADPAAARAKMGITDGPGGDKAGEVSLALLVGVWEVVKADDIPAGSTLEFSRAGKFLSTPNAKDRSMYEGTFKIKGDQVTIDPAGMSITVKELTQTKLVIDGFGGLAEYKRKGAAATARAMPKAVTKSGGFRVGVQPRAGAGAGKWEVVTSKKGGFTVEMPTQPHGEENMSGGGFEMHTITGDSSGLEFLVMTVQGPTEIPEEEEAKALGRLRDQAASKFGTGLEVVSEKSAQLGSIEGQEFELKLEKASVGTVKARGRAFANGKTAYLLLAVSTVKDRELPADAKKFLDSFSPTDRTGGATAKAKTKAKPRTPSGETRSAADPLKDWGKEIDPSGDVTMKASGASLRFEIPGTPHVLAPERGQMNAPRVVAPARGEFSVTVRVDGAFRPSSQSTVKGLSSRQAGGLILWKDSGNYLVFQHRTTSEDGKTTNQAVLEELVAGAKGVTHRPAVAEGATFLRLERKRGRIIAAFSADGKEWKDLKPVDTTWADGEIQVGVVAVNTSTTPHTVTFEDYSLKSR